MGDQDEDGRKNGFDPVDIPDEPGGGTAMGGSIFGAMAGRIVANGWSVFPQATVGGPMEAGLRSR